MKINEIIIEKIEEGGGGGAAAAFNFKQNADPAYDKPIDWKKFRKNSKRSDSDNDTGSGVHPRDKHKIGTPVKEASPPYTAGVDPNTGQKFYQVGNQKFASEKNAMKASRQQPVAQTTQQKKPAAQPTIGGRSPRMDKIVKTMTPHRGSTSQADLATVARIASAGGSAEDWQKRYGQKAKPTQVARPKQGGVVGSETTSTSFGNASDIRKPVVTQQPNDQMISVSKDNVQSAKMPNTVSKSKFKSRMPTTAGTKDPYGTDQGINLKPKKIGQ